MMLTVQVAYLICTILYSGQFDTALSIRINGNSSTTGGTYATGSTVTLAAEFYEIDFSTYVGFTWTFCKSPAISCGIDFELQDYCEGTENMDASYVNISTSSIRFSVTWRDASHSICNESVRSEIVYASGGGILPSNLTIKDCPVQFHNVTFEVVRGNPIYLSNATIRCGMSELFNISEGRPATRTETVCGQHAKWDGMAELQCWSEPEVKLQIQAKDGTNSNQGNLTVTNGTTVVVRCIFSQHGFPLPHSMVHFGNEILDQQEVSKTVDFHHNNNTIFCNYSNRYTAYYHRTNQTDEAHLTVLFGPVDANSEFSCMNETCGKANTCVDIDVRFFANANITSTRITVLDGSSAYEPYFTWGSYIKYAVKEQIYSKRGLEVPADAKDFSFEVNFTLLGTPHRFALAFVVSTSCNQATTSTSHGSEYPTAHNSHTGVTQLDSVDWITENWRVVLGVGCLILGILCVILVCCILHKRRSSGKCQKEDVANPLYGTTSMTASPQTTPPLVTSQTGAEKEERANPLYGTTNASGQASEVVYAPVVKKKKKKEKKDVAASSSSDHAEATVQADVYASVDKIKNVKKNKKDADTKGQTNAGFSVEADSMYAAVDKKKGKPKKKSSDEPSTSGLGTSGDVAQECTYAAVQKKGKKNPKSDDSDDEDLHGSTRAPKK